MPIQVASNLIPKNGAKWSIVEDTYVKGGLRVVADAAARDAIFLDGTAVYTLKMGMLLVTADDKKLWQYQGSGVWTQFKVAISYTFTQDTPSDTWDITHNNNSTFFTYTLFDADGYQVIPADCHITDVNNLVLSFAAPIAGHATFVFDV